MQPLSQQPIYSYITYTYKDVKISADLDDILQSEKFNCPNNGYIRQLKSNICLKHPGEVAGSEEKTKKEIAVLCNRVMHDVNSVKRKYSIPPPPTFYWFAWSTPVTSVIQGFRRPRCGLVALFMAGKMMKKQNPSIKLYDDSSILKVARALNYSCMGEMFSAYNLAKLATFIYKCKSVVIDGPLSSYYPVILSHLAKGYPVLLPYDSDKNFEPSLLKGHHAHWALLTGVVIGAQKKIKATVKENHGGINIIENPREFVTVFDDQKLLLSNIYVFAKQGKSAKLQLWSLKALNASNSNLTEQNPNKDWSLYKVPNDGIIKNLCSKSVLLYPSAD